MTSQVFGIHAVFSLFDNHSETIGEIFLQDNYQKNKKLNAIANKAKEFGVVVGVASKKKLDEMCGGANHQGVVCLVNKPRRQFSEKELEFILDGLTEPPFVLILDQITDPHNLGACLRTAAAAGVHVIIAPKDGSAALTPTAIKISCGAADTVPYIQVTNLSRTMKMLQQRGIWITGTSLVTDKLIYDLDFSGAVAIVIGSEGKGMRRLVEENCDFLAKIPLSDAMESLNASVAAGICLFEVVRQRSCAIDKVAN